MPHVRVAGVNLKLVNVPAVTSTSKGRKFLRVVKIAARLRAKTFHHAHPVQIALAGEEILHANSLATVTRNFVAIRRPDRSAEIIIGLHRISKIKHIKTSLPGYLVIASGAWLLAAAAACSKEGNHAGLPLAVLGGVFALAHLISRRGAVAFVVDREVTDTNYGSPAEAAELVRAMTKALPRLLGNPLPLQTWLVIEGNGSGLLRHRDLQARPAIRLAASNKN